MSQGSFSPKIRFLGQKVCSVARSQTDRQTDTKVNTEDTLSGFQDFSNFPSTYHQGAVQNKKNVKTHSSGVHSRGRPTESLTSSMQYHRLLITDNRFDSI